MYYRTKPEYDPNAPLTDDSLANHSQRWRVTLYFCVGFLPRDATQSAVMPQ